MGRRLWRRVEKFSWDSAGPCLKRGVRSSGEFPFLSLFKPLMGLPTQDELEGRPPISDFL